MQTSQPDTGITWLLCNVGRAGVAPYKEPGKPRMVVDRVQSIASPSDSHEGIVKPE